MKVDYKHLYQQRDMLLGVNALFPIWSPNFLMALINSEAPLRSRKELFVRKEKCQ